MLLHATCVSVHGKGVLLLGKPGSGKSDLAIRLIDGGATLVADDQVQILKIKNTLRASAPARLKGLLEARGVGILNLPYKSNIKMALAVQLVSRKKIERLPEPEVWGCLGRKLPLLSLHAFDESTPAKIRLFLRTV